MTIPEFALIGAYTVMSVIGGLLWKEIRALRHIVEQSQVEWAELMGLIQGQEHEKRLSRIERKLWGD